MMVMAMCLALWAVGVAIFLLLVMVMPHDCRPVVLVLVVQVVVAVPTELSAREEELLRELAEIQDDHVVDKGFLREFWDRLTS